MTKVYFVRHAQPNYQNHDDLTRELSAKGMKDRELVTAFLKDKQIRVVLSSPLRRAVDTVQHFADSQGLPVQIVADFRERKVDDGWIGDFDGFARAQWKDFDYQLPGGESLREVQRRNIAALKWAIETYPGEHIAVGSHGTALGTILHYYASFDYADFQNIKHKMPWIVCFSFDNGRFAGLETFDLL